MKSPHYSYGALVVCALLTACSLPGWLGGSKAEKPRRDDAGKRLAVVAETIAIEKDPQASDIVADLPDQVKNSSWESANQAMQDGHLGITGTEEAARTTIGEGAAFMPGVVPAPVVANGILYAMDGIGVISAHSLSDIDERHFVSHAMVEEDEPDLLGGGLAIDGDILYAASGYGQLAALDAKTGKKRWKISVGVPVRGAPRVEAGVVVVVTVDNQTLGFDAASGKALWTHRGIRETAGYLSSISPVISDGIVVVAYSSGELFGLRLESGTPLWTDTLINPERTRASDVFTGIDADPIVKDSIVYAISTSGVMGASALLNGRPLWQQKIDGYETPWVVGNMVYVITSGHQLVALHRGSGRVVWTVNLTKKDNGQDVTPPLFGPILAGNAVLVVQGDGNLRTFRPRDGKKLGSYEVVDNVAFAPLVVEGQLILLTQDAKLAVYR
jgi:outer membrane protein assembly factor BamB